MMQNVSHCSVYSLQYYNIVLLKSKFYSSLLILAKKNKISI